MAEPIHRPCPRIPLHRGVLSVLLAADGLIVLLAPLFWIGWLESTWFWLGAEPSLGESVQHVKLFGIAVMTGWLYRVRRQAVYAALTAFFLVVFFDDVGQLHETIGEALVPVLDLAPRWGLRARDFGELAFMGTWAVVLLVLSVWAYALSDRASRCVALQACVAIAALAAFGVGADALHQVGKTLIQEHGWPNQLNFALAVLEEGGEMVVMSGIAAAAFTHWRASSAAPVERPSRR